LVHHFTRRLRPRQPPRFNAEALEALGRYAWPGNVRELANVVERLLILGGGAAEIGLAAVQQVIPAGRAPGGPAPGASDGGGLPLAESLDAYERELIGNAIARADGNVAEAARQLRTDRANLYRRMRRLGLQ
ncbi:MAG: helix-turn-helix domain-containing protein, partial [Gemmatimonadales bacterium]